MSAMAERRGRFMEVRRPANTYPPGELAFSVVLDRIKKPQNFDAKEWEEM